MLDKSYVEQGLAIPPPPQAPLTFVRCWSRVDMFIFVKIFLGSFEP